MVNRTEPNRTEPNRTEPNRTDQPANQPVSQPAICLSSVTQSTKARKKNGINNKKSYLQSRNEMVQQISIGVQYRQYVLNHSYLDAFNVERGLSSLECIGLEELLEVLGHGTTSTLQHQPLLQRRTSRFWTKDDNVLLSVSSVSSVAVSYILPWSRERVR